MCTTALPETSCAEQGPRPPSISPSTITYPPKLFWAAAKRGAQLGCHSLILHVLAFVSVCLRLCAFVRTFGLVSETLKSAFVRVCARLLRSFVFVNTPFQCFKFYCDFQRIQLCYFITKRRYIFAMTPE